MIKMFQVSKSFVSGGRSHPALRGVSLSVEAGHVFGIVGESGAGKSTLVRCLALLERPDAGQIYLENEDLTLLSPAALRKRRRQVGLVFQHFNLLGSKTVRQNIALPLTLGSVEGKEAQKRVDHMLELVGLSRLAERRPSALSGGQKQRVGIARALIMRPSVLLLDEATSALDPLATRSILQLVRRIHEETRITTVLITHEMDVVESLCDEVAVLSAGQVAESGPVAEIFLRPQTEAARALLKGVEPPGPAPELLTKYRARLHAAPDFHELVCVTAEGAVVDTGGLFDAARDAKARMNLLAGGIHRIGPLPYGRLIVELIGSLEEREALCARLRAQGLGVAAYTPQDEKVGPL